MAAPHTFYADSEAAEALRANPGYVQGAADPNVATGQTVRYMCSLIKDSLADGIVQRATVDARRFEPFGDLQVRRLGQLVPGAIWWWVKHAVKFVHHSKMLAEWMDAPDELQLLIRPDALLKMRHPKGDCAVFTTLICAMLDCAGVPWEIVTVAVDPRVPGVYSHVYPRAVLENGARLPMDASHGLWPGWEVPRAAVTALQIWDRDGNPIPDMESL